MRREKWKVALCLVLVAVALGNSLGQDLTALNLPDAIPPDILAPGIEVGTYPGQFYGWEFKPSANIRITELGLWLHPLDDDFAGAHEIAIYPSGSTEAVVLGSIGPAGNREADDYVYSPPDSSETLTAGASYIIAAYSPASGDGSDDFVLNLAVGYTMNSEINLVLGASGECGRLSSTVAGLREPEAQTGSFMFSPNFKFEVVTNQPPVAVDDAAETTVNRPVTINVLGNDSDPDGDVISVESVTPAVEGTVTVNDDGTITYTPSPEFEGPDTFEYTISDVDGATDTATVTVVGPVVMIEDLIADVEHLNGSYGIPNSLDAKLEAAQKSLEDANQNNDVAAVNKLQAFINEVEAQSGNQIEDPEDADRLIAAAQAIIDLLTAS